jgi:hypothetical protein
MHNVHACGTTTKSCTKLFMSLITTLSHLYYDKYYDKACDKVDLICISKLFQKHDNQQIC